MFAFLFKTLFRLFALLPLGMLHSLGALLGRLTYAASAQYAARTRENLRRAGLTAGTVEYRSVLSATIAAAGKGITELAWIWGRPYDEVVSKVRECIGLEHIIAAQARGKGIIFLTPHLGCFEISALYAARRVPITVLYRPPKLGWLEGVMRGGRERGQARLAKADVGGVRLLYKALKRGEAVGLLPDQVPSRGEGEWADFFGRPAYTMTLAGRLAESSDATVLIAYSERLPRGQGYVIHVEPLALDFTAPVPQQVNAALERTIRACPAQYLWSYNRYKIPRGMQPPGARTEERGAGIARPTLVPACPNFRSEAVTRLGIFLMWLLHFLPLPLLARVGNALGMLLYWSAGERRHVAATNLRLCFPELSEAERRALARKNFQAFARSFLERGILWWGTASRIQKHIRVEGLGHYTAAQARGPVIVLAPHFVALDVGGSWMIQHVDLVSVYSSQKNPLFHKMLLHGRSRFGEQKLYMRQQGLRPVIKAMREGRPFYYLPDQDLATKDGVFVPFFGVPAATLTTVPRLAAMTGAQVVPCISKLLPGGKGYEVRFYPAWENYPTGDVTADTRRMNEFIEQRVREMPEQYFWLHKRFKTRPRGQKKLY